MFRRAVLLLSFFACLLAPSLGRAGCDEPINDPEFTVITEPATKLVVAWRANCGYSHFNLRWAVPGRAPVQVERDGDKRQYIFNRMTNTVYTFSLQGCDSRLARSSRCTEWVSETILSCGTQSNPCGHPRGVVHPVRAKSAAGKCLDVNAPDQLKNGARIQVWDCNGADQQTWIRRDEALMTKNGKCLDVHAPDQARNGGRVQLWACNGTQQQKWRIDGSTIRSAAGKCLDVNAPDQNKNGGLVQVWDCNGSSQQRWDAQGW